MRNKEVGENFKLTQREAQILELISKGKTNTEIAGLLNLSVHTVKVYVAGILRKLEVNDRTQAAVKAIKHKIIYVN